MKYRILGKTGLKVSVIGMGTWQFGGEWGKNYTVEEVRSILRRAKELGYNLIDTAECYGDHLSESLIGEAIEQMGDRKYWVIATKFGHFFRGFLDRSEPRTPKDIEQQLHQSLKALRTDYIDLYQYHSFGDKDFADDGIIEVLFKAKKAGKIRHVGNSVGLNNTDHQVKDSSRHYVEAIQVVYNRLQREPETAIFPTSQRLNLGVLARVPLASGYLAGQYQIGKRFAPNDVRSRTRPEEIDRRIAEVQRIQREEVPPEMRELPMATWALSMNLKHPAVTCVIPGCKDIKQVELNATAADYVDE